jgi:periplasmic protein TonB
MAESEQTSRRPYRPPIGIPSTGENRRQATAAALALHALLILLVLAPTIFVSTQLLDYMQQGAGGPGPAGGGGGGNQSFPGRIKYFPEKVDFLKLETKAIPVPKQDEVVKP